MTPAESLREKLIYFLEPGITHKKEPAERRTEAGRLVDEYTRELAEEHAAMLRAYPDYCGVMDLAAALVLGEDHPHRRHDHPAPDVSARPVGGEETNR